MTRAVSFGRMAALFAALLVAVPAAGEPAGSGKREQVEEKLRALRHEVLKRDVGLTGDRMAKVQQILSESASERRAVHQRLRDHRKALQRLVEENSQDQKAYEKALDGFRRARVEKHAIESRELDALAEVLTPKEQAKLYVALQKLRRKMAQAVRKHRRRGD